MQSGNHDHHQTQLTSQPMNSYRGTEQIHHVPCQCETSPVGRAVQSRASEVLEHFVDLSFCSIRFDQWCQI